MTRFVSPRLCPAAGVATKIAKATKAEGPMALVILSSFCLGFEAGWCICAGEVKRLYRGIHAVYVDN
jgi:hypothetical protein